MLKKTTLFSLLWMLSGFAALSVLVFFLFYYGDQAMTMQGSFSPRNIAGLLMQPLLCLGLGWLLAKRGFSLHWGALLVIPAVLLLFFLAPEPFWQLGTLFTGSNRVDYGGFASLPLWKQLLLTNVISVRGALSLEAGLGCLGWLSRPRKIKMPVPAAE